jgi:hypothetical protein
LGSNEYGLEDEIDALLRYLETYGEVNDDRLPEWDKFQELAADYEVPLPPRDQHSDAGTSRTNSGESGTGYLNRSRST